MKKKKDTTPVPVSSQRQDQDQMPTATTSQSSDGIAAVPSATTDVVTGASEDIFAQVEKLEEDLGLGPKRRKAKEVCCSAPFLSTFSFHCFSPPSLFPFSVTSSPHVSLCSSPLPSNFTDSCSHPAAQVLDSTLQDVPPQTQRSRPPNRRTTRQRSHPADGVLREEGQ